METQSKSQKLSGIISKWAQKLDEIEGWKEWNHKKFQATMRAWDSDSSECPEEFVFPEKIDHQHSVIMSYLELSKSLESLKNLEYYFSKFNFRGSSISRYQHLRYVCELYFGRFYEFRERLKKFFDNLKKVSNLNSDGIGKFIKEYDKRFELEIKERHSIHHNSYFSETKLNKLMILELTFEENNPIYDEVYKLNYKRISKEWVERVRLKSKELDNYLNFIASLIISTCDFLKENKVE